MCGTTYPLRAMKIDKLKFSAFFYHPDYTVGSGIHERCHRISRLSGSRTIPPVGNHTPPRRTNLKYAYQYNHFDDSLQVFFIPESLFDRMPEHGTIGK